MGKDDWIWIAGIGAVAAGTALYFAPDILGMLSMGHDENDGLDDDTLGPEAPIVEGNWTMAHAKPRAYSAFNASYSQGYPSSYLARSYATYSCSDLCKMGKCDAYNCRGDCTAGCSACGGASAVGRGCLSCSNLCSLKRCSDYNCRCTAGCTACGGVSAVGNCGAAPSPSPSPSPSPTPSPSSGSTGTEWYKAKGSKVSMPNHRCSTGTCGSSSSNSGGNRWETVQSGWFSSGFEVVVYFYIPSGKMCSGGHIGLKHGGPEHTSPCGYRCSCGQSSSSCCCWWDTGIDNDHKQAYVEIERPHPHNMNRKYYASIGRELDTGSPIGVRWLIAREGSGIRLMQWVDTSGKTAAYQWKQTYNVLDTGQFMPSSYYSHIPSTQNVEIRISDVKCGDIHMTHGPYTRRF